MSSSKSVSLSAAALRPLSHKLLGLVLASVFIAGSAAAQTRAPQPTPSPVAGVGALKGPANTVTYSQRTNYDFDNEEVRGEVVKPDMDVVTVRSKTNHKSLVCPRTTFQPEMLKSVESL